jgi:predicted transcriptional regulator
MENVLDKKLQKYFVKLNDFEKKSVLSVMKAFISKKVLSHEIYTVEQYNKEIDEAIAEVESGNFVTQEEMEKIALKW